MSVVTLRHRMLRLRPSLLRTSGAAGVALLALGLVAGPAAAKTWGFATLPAGTLNYRTAAAVAKVLKEKADLNVLVQPTAGDTVIIPMVARKEADIGISNAIELSNAYEGLNAGAKMSDLRIIATAHPLKTAFWVRKDSPMHTIADLKGKRVVMGYSAMPVINTLTKAILATGGLTQKDVKPVLVPNVVRGADDFVNGASDMYFFAFGAPKVREVEATVGGTRVLSIDPNGMAAARKVSKWGYLTEAKLGPVFIGVDKPMPVYTFDNVFFTNASVPDDVIYKFLDTLAKNKQELVQIQPVLRAFSPAAGYKQYEIPYHPGALKYFKEHHLKPQPLQ